MFADIVINDVYNAVLSPSQAILMLKGYNPTTPKETVKMFKEVLLAKEKVVSKKDVDTLEETVGMFKKIEHDKDLLIKGADVDRLLKNAEDFMKNIKKMFEEISEDRTKESIITSYNELLNQMRSLPGYSDMSETELFASFDKDFVKSAKMPSFVGGAIKNVVKAKKDYDSGKVTVTEVNKVLKELRNVLAEIKSYRDRNTLSEVNRRRLHLSYDKNKNAEILNYDGKVCMIDYGNDKVYELSSHGFEESKLRRENLGDTTKIGSLSIDDKLFESAKKALNAKELNL